MTDGELGAVFRKLAQESEGAVKRISDKIATFAEDGAAHAKAGVEDVLESDRGAHDRINLAGGRTGTAGDLDRLKSTLDDRALSKYSDQELRDIVEHGRGIGLTPEESADFATAGAIPKPVSAKYPLGRERLSPEDLKQQMDNWVGEVRPRGYPYLFESKEQFQSFGAKLTDLGEAYGLPKGRTLVQGSSLRNPEAKDVDIAVIAPDREFDEYAARAKQGIIDRAAEHNRQGLLDDLDDHLDKGFVPNFMFDRPEGMGSFGRQLFSLKKQFGLGDVDFSIMKESSAMALYPHLDISGSTHE